MAQGSAAMGAQLTRYSQKEQLLGQWQLQLEALSVQPPAVTGLNGSLWKSFVLKKASLLFDSVVRMGQWNVQQGVTIAA